MLHFGPLNCKRFRKIRSIALFSKDFKKLEKYFTSRYIDSIGDAAGFKISNAEELIATCQEIQWATLSDRKITTMKRKLTKEEA